MVFLVTVVLGDDHGQAGKAELEVRRQGRKVSTGGAKEPSSYKRWVKLEDKILKNPTSESKKPVAMVLVHVSVSSLAPGTREKIRSPSAVAGARGFGILPNFRIGLTVSLTPRVFGSFVPSSEAAD